MRSCGASAATPLRPDPVWKLSTDARPSRRSPRKSVRRAERAKGRGAVWATSGHSAQYYYHMLLVRLGFANSPVPTFAFSIFICISLATHSRIHLDTFAIHAQIHPKPPLLKDSLRGSSVKIGTMQRRLARRLRKENTPLLNRPCIAGNC